jgi:hypothetical protein
MTTTNTAADATAAIDTCLRDHFCWQPEAILIDGGLDKPPIDVMEAFCYDDPVNFGGKFVFPPDVYPPTWEDRKKLEDAIINAALIHSKTQLIRLKTITTKLQNGTMVTELGCYKGRRYYSSVKGKNLTSNDIYNSTAGNEENVPVYKDGIRQDRLVNKDKANRSRDKGKGAGKKDPRRTNTKKPPLGLICKFKIRLILVPGKHWFINKSTKDKVKHNHSKLDKEEMVLRTSHLSNEDRDKLVLYKQYTNGGAATNLINSQLGGFNLSQDQVRGAAEKRQEETQELPEIDGTSHANKLVALLKKLSAQGHLKFIALFHEIQDTSLVAVSKYHQKKEEAERKKRKEAAEALVELSQVDDAPTKINLDVVGSNVGPSTGPQIQLQSPEDELSLGMILEPIRDRLKVGQKVLLAAAWARNDERRLFEMFPEVLMFDVTAGTNSEGRPLGCTASPDGNMKVFTPVRVFMPSECYWVFHWIFRTAIPSLLGKDSLKRTQLVLSDGDKNIYNAFDNCREELYPNAVHALCMYHLVTKQLHEQVRRRLLDPDETVSKDMICTFKYWLFSWMSIGGVETEEEWAMSHNALRSWLESFKSSDNASMKHNAAELETFLVKSILPHKPRWFVPGRIAKSLLTLNQKTSSPLEGVNHTMKCKSSKKVLPEMSIKTSFETQETQVKSRMDMWLRNARQDAESCQQLWVTGSATANHINNMGESVLQQRLSQRPNYHVRCVNHGIIEVLRVEGSKSSCHDCAEETQVICPTCSNSSPIPKFRRVRRISFLPLNGGSNYVVSCTCPHHSNTGIPCQHIVKVLPVIRPHHFHIRWHRKYAAYYKKPGYEELTKHFHLMQKDRRLVISREEYQLAVGCAVAATQPELSTLFLIRQPLMLYDSARMALLPHDQVVASSKDERDPILQASQEIYAMGLMSQEDGGLELELEDENEDEEMVQKKARKSISYTGNLRQDAIAVLHSLMNRLEHNPELSGSTMSDYFEFMGTLHRKLDRSTRSKADDQGEFVNPFPEKTDTRRRWKRKKNAAEPRREKKWEKDKTRLSIDSLI